MNKKFELLREAVGTYRANHCSGAKNEKELLEFIDELEALNITTVIEWHNIVDVQPKEGQKIEYKGNIDSSIKAEFVFFDKEMGIGWCKNDHGEDCFDEWKPAVR
jgi:hypothetical protein